MPKHRSLFGAVRQPSAYGAGVMLGFGMLWGD